MTERELPRLSASTLHSSPPARRPSSVGYLPEALTTPPGTHPQVGGEGLPFQPPLVPIHQWPVSETKCSGALSLHLLGLEPRTSRAKRTVLPVKRQPEGTERELPRLSASTLHPTPEQAPRPPRAPCCSAPRPGRAPDLASLRPHPPPHRERRAMLLAPAHTAPGMGGSRACSEQRR